MVSNTFVKELRAKFWWFETKLWDRKLCKNICFQVVIWSISTWAPFWTTRYPWIRCNMESSSEIHLPFPALCGRGNILEQCCSQHPHNQLPHRGGGPARWVCRRIYSGVVENKRFFANNPNEVFLPIIRNKNKTKPSSRTCRWRSHGRNCSPKVATSPYLDSQ